MCGRCMARASSALVSSGTGLKCSVVIFDLLQALASSLEFAVRGFLRLLDEAVQDHDLASDHRAVERSANSFSTLAPATAF